MRLLHSIILFAFMAFVSYAQCALDTPISSSCVCGSQTISSGYCCDFGSGPVPSTVKCSHPRIWLTDEKLSDLRAKACYDGFGAVIEDCTPDSTWTVLKAEADKNLNRDFYGNDGLNWDGSSDVDSDLRAGCAIYLVNFATVYQITKNSAYARAAIDKMLQFWDTPPVGYTTDTWITYDMWYTSRYLVPSSALVFDWTYDQMTDAERARFISQLDTWASMIAVSPTPAWAWSDSSNNYWYGYMWALASAGYAIEGHSPNAEIYIDYVKNTMVPEALNQVNDAELNTPICLSDEISSCRYYGASKGGEWSEGNPYGRTDTNMFISTLLAIKSIDGDDFFSQTQFFDESILMTIYNVPPAQGFLVEVGDGSCSIATDGLFKFPFQFSIIGAALRDANSLPAQYGKYFLDQSIVLSWTLDQYKHSDFIWRPTSQVKTNYNVLPSYYFAEGMKIQTYRSNWNSNALWFYSRFNQHYSDHTNDGMGGHFSLFKNGWLIKDAAYDEYPGSGPNNIYHNVVYFPFEYNRHMIWGNTQVLHRENAANYIYYAGDATDVYLSAEADDHVSGVTANLVQRFFFYIKDNYLAVYDRTSTLAPTDEKIWQIYLGGLPSVSGDTVSYYNGVSKVFVKSLLPLNPSVNIDTYDSEYRMNLRNPVAQNYNNFLNVIEVKDGDTSMSPASLITSTTGNMLGSQIANQYVVMFSSGGSVINSTTYSVSATGSLHHFLTGMLPYTVYYLTGASTSTATSSANGVLEFDTSGSVAVTASTSTTGTIWHMTPDGVDDSDCGSEAGPCFSLDWLLDKRNGAYDNTALVGTSLAQPGDKIYIHSGDYSYYNIYGNIQTDTMLQNIGGNATHWITIQGAPGEPKPVFHDAWYITHWSNTPDDGRYDSRYFIIKDIIFRDTAGTSINIDDGGGDAPRLTPAGYFLIDNIEIYNSGGNPIKLAGVDHFEIRNTKIVNGTYSAIDLVGVHEGNLHHNYINGCTNGIMIKGGARNVWAHHNWIENARATCLGTGLATSESYFRPLLGTTDPDGMVMLYEAKNFTYSSNICYNTVIFAEFANTVGGRVVNNVLYSNKPYSSSDSTSLLKLVRIWEAGYHGVRGAYTLYYSQYGEFKNNILFFPKSYGSSVSETLRYMIQRCDDVSYPMSTIGTMVFANNLFYRYDAPPYSSPDWDYYVSSACGSPTHYNNTYSQDPLFVNSLLRDFHLQSGSPAIGAGTYLGTAEDYDGIPFTNPPSIGAFEYAGAVPPTCTDSDHDGYYSTAGCGTAVDCNDANANIHPYATEICSNGIDEDCSGADLTCATCPQNITSRCLCGGIPYDSGYCCDSTWQATTCPSCDEVWNCTSWSACVDNLQTRACTDINSCGTELYKPAEQQVCDSGGTTGGSSTGSSGGASSGSTAGSSSGSSSGGGGVSAPPAEPTCQSENEVCWDSSDCCAGSCIHGRCGQQSIQGAYGSAYLRADESKNLNEEITVYIEGEDGQPIGNAVVYVVTPSSEVIPVVTDANGQASFTAEQVGEYQYYAPGYDLLSQVSTYVGAPRSLRSYCGDSTCSIGETCISCPGDCGMCAPRSGLGGSGWLIVVFVSFLFFAVSVISMGGYLYVKRRNRHHENLPAKPEDVKVEV